MTRKVIILLFILMTSITSCRYKEGPMISFHSIYKRLLGTWQIVEFTSNGVDSLQYYNDSCGATMRVYKPYHDEGDYLNFSGKKEFLASSSFVDKKKVLKVWFFSFNNGSQYWSLGPIGVNRKSEWKILKLTMKEFKISTDFNGNNYNISFKKL